MLFFCTGTTDVAQFRSSKCLFHRRQSSLFSFVFFESTQIFNTQIINKMSTFAMIYKQLSEVFRNAREVDRWRFLTMPKCKPNSYRQTAERDN